MGTIRITVRAKPGSSRARVGGRYGTGDDLIVAVNAPAVDGKANDAIVRAVAHAFDIPRRSVVVASGHTARSKVLSITVDDADEPYIQETLARLLGE